LAIAANSTDFEITTIEGLAGDGPMTDLQRAFVEGAAMQCGFCTPGMLMALTGLFNDNATPDETEIRHAISGNLCRCTGYVKIVQAAQRVAKGVKG
jgi:aerobic-type carbon monoxide dehydrogenase small subunit (CoxS/CutS family)